MATFQVGERRFTVGDWSAGLGDGGAGFVVQSSPRPYRVDVVSPGQATAEALDTLLGGQARPMLIADRRVAELHLDRDRLSSRLPCLFLDASEDLKSLDGVVTILEFLVDNGAAKDSMVVVAGGGVLQDAAGFACAVFKRGIAWTYVPTTLLAQADSCIGAKTAVNFKRTKNLLGMFFAPRRVLLHAGFVATLPSVEILSGLGEILKLCITGGPSCLDAFEARLERAVGGDAAVLGELACLSLAVKLPVIEADELDTNERRALNFGHSVGHGLEVLTGYELSHGTAVCAGALVECELSRARGLLADSDFARLVPTARALLPNGLKDVLAGLDVGSLLEVLGRDKKVDGRILKLAVPVALGHIELLDFHLGAAGAEELESAVARVLTLL